MSKRIKPITQLFSTVYNWQSILPCQKVLTLLVVLLIVSSASSVSVLAVEKVPDTASEFVTENTSLPAHFQDEHHVDELTTGVKTVENWHEPIEARKVYGDDNEIYNSKDSLGAGNAIYSTHNVPPYFEIRGLRDDDGTYAGTYLRFEAKKKSNLFTSAGDLKPFISAVEGEGNLKFKGKTERFFRTIDASEGSDGWTTFTLELRQPKQFEKWLENHRIPGRGLILGVQFMDTSKQGKWAVRDVQMIVHRGDDSFQTELKSDSPPAELDDIEATELVFDYRRTQTKTVRNHGPLKTDGSGTLSVALFDSSSGFQSIDRVKSAPSNTWSTKRVSVLNEIEKHGADVSFRFRANLGAAYEIRNVRLVWQLKEKSTDDKRESPDADGEDPVAKFDFTPDAPETGEIVRFDASSSRNHDGEIVEYRWLFESGTHVQTAPEASTVFDQPGDKEVTLVVKDDQGNTDRITKTITVSENVDPPEAKFDYGPMNPTVGDLIEFTAEPSHNDTKWEWDFDGDGDFEKQGHAVDIRFDSPGERSVTLRVTGENDQTDTHTEQVVVRESDDDDAGDDGDDSTGDERDESSDDEQDRSSDGDERDQSSGGDEGDRSDDGGQDQQNSDAPSDDVGDDRKSHDPMAVALLKATVEGEQGVTAESGERITLSAENSADNDGRIVSYEWEAIDGTPVRLHDRNTETPYFVVPDDLNGTTLRFRLTVTDDDGNTDSAVIDLSPDSGRSSDDNGSNRDDDSNSGENDGGPSDDGENDGDPSNDERRNASDEGVLQPPFTEEFDSGIGDWIVDLHPDAGDRVTEGEGEWTSEYGGSVHLHVDGGPNHVGVYREVGPLREGTNVTVNYESPNLADEPGSPRILLHPPGTDEVIKLDADPGRESFDGVLEGTVPRDLPAGTELEVRLGVWPGEIDVYVTDVRVQPPTDEGRDAGENDRSNGGRSTDESEVFPTEPVTANGTTVQYVNCSAVKVTGSGSVDVRTLGYYKAGDYFQEVEHTVDGTEIIRAPVDEDLISSDRGYISYVDPGPGLRNEITNPRREQCAEAIRPEKIDVFVENATRVGENTYEVTFGYDNPNDYSMSSAWDYDPITSQFSFFMSNYDDKSDRQDLREGSEKLPSTNRSPPSEFLPGRHTFTVEWTPRQEDARLVWIVDLEYFRYEDPELSAKAPSAANIGSSGEENDGDSDTPPQLRRVGTDTELSVTPGTEVMLEVAAPEYDGQYVETEWTIEGEGSTETRRPLGPFHSWYQGEGRDYLRHTFESPGTYDVTVVMYGENGTELGTTSWTVNVEDGGSEPPAVDRVTPDAKEVSNPGGSRDFTFEASDSGGDLDRVVWWRTQCDVLLEETSVSGSESTVTLSHEPSDGCGVLAWVVDENGAMTTIGWTVPLQVTSTNDETTTRMSTSTTREVSTTTETSFGTTSERPTATETSRTTTTEEPTTTTATEESTTETTIAEATTTTATTTTTTTAPTTMTTTASTTTTTTPTTTTTTTTTTATTTTTTETTSTTTSTEEGTTAAAEDIGEETTYADRLSTGNPGNVPVRGTVLFGAGAALVLRRSKR